MNLYIEYQILVKFVFNELSPEEMKAIRIKCREDELIHDVCQGIFRKMKQYNLLRLDHNFL